MKNDSIVSLLGCKTTKHRTIGSVSPASTLSPTSSSTSTCCLDEKSYNRNEAAANKEVVSFDLQNHFPYENFQFNDSEEIFASEGDYQNQLTSCNEINSQNFNFWIQKLSHQISVKPDRCEFEVIKAQLFNLLKSVSKIRQIQKSSSGGIGPFLMVTNRAVSRGTAHHFNQSKCAMPKFAELKNGNQCILSNQNIRRAAGGSHDTLGW